MKYYIIAGEPSGDLHGSNLMKALKDLDSDAKFAFWGGDHMLKVDDEIVTHIRETSIMGFVEVVKNISKIKSLFKTAKASILTFEPDVLVLIDYPGFNLRMAKWAKKKGFKVVYYISPQLWAWKKGRVKSIKKYVDEMIVILPFELEFYRKYGVNVHYVGHPLVPVIQLYKASAKVQVGDRDRGQILAILPGSRKQEITKILPAMMHGASHFKDEFRLCVAVAPNLEEDFYQELLSEFDLEVEFVKRDTYGLLSKAQLALVTSGTATLETALFGVPQVVCYKTSTINYKIGKRLVDLEYISLVNLISGKEIVPELIQNEVNSANIIEAIKAILNNAAKMKSDYKTLHDLLAANGSPSEKAAKVILETSLG